jgi:photosynthetic reaction center cytochrome c subunit
MTHSRTAVTALLALCCVTLAAAFSAREDQIPQTFTNLQVLPKNISRGDLVATMKGFTSALGVRCEHCHVGEGNDLSKFDFASDAKPTKKAARTMVHMVDHINAEHLKGIGDAARQPKVTCFTCHRGARTPATLPGG